MSMGADITKRVPERNSYLIPGPLMHALIVTVLAAIVVIGGYMIAWAKNDAEFKVEVLTKLGALETRVVEIGEDQDEHEHEKHVEK